jgi:hypothetical protein
MQRFPVFVCVMACLVLGPYSSGQPAQSSAGLDQQKQLEIEQRKLSLDRERFTFEQNKYERDHSLETLKTFATVLSLAIPLMAAVVAYILQVRTRRQDEALAFQLKAAEIIMASRDTGQAKGKAELLTRLFPGRLVGVEQALKEPGQYPYFGRSNETREEMLKLLAKYPESRADIIRAWAILFPWDSGKAEWDKKSGPERSTYKWLDKLRDDGELNQNKLTPHSSRGPVSGSPLQT